MNQVSYRLEWIADGSLRVSFDDAGGRSANDRVRAFAAELGAGRVRSLIDATPTASAVVLTFDLATLDAASAQIEAGAIADDSLAVTSAHGAGRRIEIPVCYDEAFAPDLASVASHHGVTAEEIVSRHSGATYRVEFLGFSPGFAYLTGMPADLATPRLDSPRLRVPAGSVGIGGSQTGVYPQSTPGGWRLIGRTPIRLFDPAREWPALLSIGDSVRFVPISASEFDRHATGGP